MWHVASYQTDTLSDPPVGPVDPGSRAPSCERGGGHGQCSALIRICVYVFYLSCMTLLIVVRI